MDDQTQTPPTSPVQPDPVTTPTPAPAPPPEAASGGPQWSGTTPNNYTGTAAAPAGNGMFSRRMGRIDFFVCCLLPGLIVAILAGLTLAASHAASGGGGVGLALIAVLVELAVAVAALPIVFSAYIRRLHDLNMTGWLSLLILIPFLGLLFALYLLFAPGTAGANNYGEPVTTHSLGVTLGFKKP